MKLIIDANILLAALIKNSKTRELILEKENELLAPDYILKEIKKYKHILKEKTNLNEKDIEHITNFIINKITIINEYELFPYFSKARNITLDKDDWQYFALALKLKIPIWTNDKKLRKLIKK
ncbi:hypothetical protein K9L97_02510 [Candidatus Woesearchaeota archaeon]|nr:hypothetical protein [Candidatus Woesearchaeota archaeon]